MRNKSREHQKFNSLINSNEYQCKLSEHLTSLLRRTRNSTTESSIAFAFESEIYHFVKNFFNIEINFRKEEGQSSLRHKFAGRMDAVYSNLVIEYKKTNKLENENDQRYAVSQLSAYLQQLLDTGHGEFYGILTDGVKLKYLFFKDGKIQQTSFKNIEEPDLDKIVQFLTDINNKRFVPQNIVDDFRLDSRNALTENLALYLFNKLRRDSSGKVKMLYEEWKVLFHLSENDKGQNEDIKKRRRALSKIFKISIQDTETDYQALFSLQTTYAIIVKLIACKVVTKIEFNKDIEYFSDLSKIETGTLREFLEYIEDGYVFQTGGIRNLLEGDFFSWYCSSSIWSEEIAEIIIRIINVLEGYSNSFYKYGFSTIDIFIALYMEIMPRQVRHSLGEYFTPAWLADRVVEEAIKFTSEDHFSAIDPCCGSGVFIMSLINHIVGSRDILTLSQTEKRKLLLSILERVKGVDINPLSVLTAKVCFYLAIKPLIKDDDIEIPIYLGDSANIPALQNLSGIECYQYTINTKQENIDIILPSSFVENVDFLSKMSQIQSIIKTEDEFLVYTKFLNSIKEEDLNSQIKSNIKSLSKQLVNLHKKNWDGIWIRIVANFMLVARIKNIDLIVGNPPWIKWEFLPQAYAEKIKSLCIDRHLFSGQTYMGAISLNICALIANVTASTWLSKKGVLAFLMPQTMMTQDSYAGFRNFFIDPKTNTRLYLQKLDDWTKSGNPFIDTTEKFMTYYYKYDYVDYYKDGIPIEKFEKLKRVPIVDINSKQTFSEVKESFLISLNKAYQMDKKRTGYTVINNADSKDKLNLIIGECAYKARSGVEFTPAEIYFLKSSGKVSEKNNHLFTPSIFKNSKYKAKSNLPILLETKFIKPVIKAPKIRAFKIERNNDYCIFPYERNNSLSIKEIYLMEKAPKLFMYLNKNRDVIEKQSKRSLTISRGKSFFSLSKVGDYTFAENKVTFRDNTTLSASVVQNVVTPWGEETSPICAKHCPYISQDKEGRNITEEEAYYICAILNAPIVVEYFKSTFSSRSYSIDFNIKIPLYNERNRNHLLLVKLSENASRNGVTKEILEEINEVYLDLCKSI